MTNPEIIKLLYRTDFKAFMRFAGRELDPTKPLHENWHIDVISDAVERCLRGEFPRLIVNAPLDILSSIDASVALAVWALGRNPSSRILSIFGTREAAAGHQRRARALMQTPRCRGLFPHLRFDNTVRDVRLAQGGELVSRVAGQTVIGPAPDVIIIENPLSPTDARDDQSRKALGAWYQSEVAPRMQANGSGVLIVLTPRLHPDDFVGLVLRGNETWRRVSIPAIATSDETWRLANGIVHKRPKYAAIQAGADARDAFRSKMYEVGAFNFLAQYQQEPRHINEHRSGHFSDVAPPDWTPEMGLPQSFFGWIPETAYLLPEIFGEGTPPPKPGAGDGLTDEQWAQATQLQQRRLRERCRAYAISGGASATKSVGEQRADQAPLHSHDLIEPPESPPHTISHEGRA
jgi:hypothetical protein